VTAAPSPQLARAELPWLASRWGPIAPPTSTATEMSVTSVTPYLGFGNERSGRHWLRADIFRSSVRSHTAATMVTTFPGPLYAGATVCAPQKTLNARMDPAGPSHDEPMRRVPGERPAAALGPRREGPNPTTGFHTGKLERNLPIRKVTQASTAARPPSIHRGTNHRLDRMCERSMRAARARPWSRSGRS
jgi:hypothetical protein